MLAFATCSWLLSVYGSLLRPFVGQVCFSILLPLVTGIVVTVPFLFLSQPDLVQVSLQTSPGEWQLLTRGPPGVSQEPVSPLAMLAAVWWLLSAVSCHGPG